jgi:hypothetical protein
MLTLSWLKQKINSSLPNKSLDSRNISLGQDLQDISSYVLTELGDRLEYLYSV